MPAIDQKLVLVAVLDWGLGHAGRSIPLIREIQRQGGRVIVASNGRAGHLLRQECPDLPYLECPAYAVYYSGRNMYWNIFRQLPRIFSAIAREHFWLKKVVGQHQVDAVISDSRFGCFHTAVPSVLLTHQLHLPLSPNRLSRMVNWWYRRLLHRFDVIWVPDQPNGLSGKLSYPSPFRHTQYLGSLSRMEPGAAPSRFKYDLLVLLSGPEPQRTVLEHLILQQIPDLPQLSVLIVQGKTDQSQQIELGGPHQKMTSHLSGPALNEAIASAAVVLCRSGYSSLMDLARLGKKAILIPTPGQPEQEYLAARCREKGWAWVCEQKQLELYSALKAIERMAGSAFPEEQSDKRRLFMVVEAFMG